MAKNSMTLAKKKVSAEDMFIELGKTAKQIAAELVVSENTVGKWRKEGKWDERREYLLAAPNRIERRLYEEMEKVLEGKDRTVNTDDVSKLNKALQDLKKVGDNPAFVYSVLEKIDLFCARHFPEHIETVTSVHRQFLHAFIEEIG